MIRTAMDSKAFMVGGGIGSMAVAAFIIRDGGVPGPNITIYEALPVLRGGLDGAVFTKLKRARPDAAPPII